jgi:primase-polymerase (primpol)-like protein
LRHADDGSRLEAVGTAELELASGVDLDDCIDVSTGQMKPWGQRVVAALNSYTEISPSGGGVKVFLEASKPGERGEVL